MIRKEGYYWVMKNNLSWDIGYWVEDRGLWYFHMSKYGHLDEELYLITETQILPPNN
jgi:hypothetical protein